MSSADELWGTARKVWRPLRVVLGIAIVAIAVIKFREAWNEAGASAVHWELHWGYIFASLETTWLMYLLLILGWRMILIGWGERIHWREGARIWTLSSLAALLPGRVWAIAGMATMAEKAGVSAAAATGSAIVMQLLSMTTGASIGLALLGRATADSLHGGVIGLAVIAIASLFGSIALCSPHFMLFLTRMLKRPTPIRALSPIALCWGLLLNAVAWGGYGLALVFLARGTLPSISLSWSLATGTFALAYLAGYLALVLPGGVGVREGVIVFLLGSQIGAVPAAALAAASRIATLVNQFGAPIPFILFRRPPSE